MLSKLLCLGKGGVSKGGVSFLHAHSHAVSDVKEVFYAHNVSMAFQPCIISHGQN